MKHDVFFHLVNVSFQIGVVLRVLRFFALVVPDPDADNGAGDGYREEKVNPQFVRNDWLCIYFFF